MEKIFEKQNNNEHPELQSAIDLYFEQRKKYHEKMYPGFAEQMLESEKRSMEESRSKGLLDNWHPGEDLLVCITENIIKSVTTESGAIDTGKFSSEHFSPEIYEVIKNAEENVLGYYIVSMNEGKTFSTKENNNNLKIISPGQGGCTNVVLTSKNKDGELTISVIHFAPSEITSLIDSLSKEKAKHSEGLVTKAILYTTEDTEQKVLDKISNSISLFNNSSLEFGHTSQEFSTDAVLLVSASKENSHVEIIMKGKKVEWTL